MIETSSLKPQASDLTRSASSAQASDLTRSSSSAQASNLMRSNLNVAVVVPVYNIERYLGACLESVLAQTHRDLEVIVVDDGSTDKSGEISDDFSRRDPRVRVIHKANGGLSDARNAALDTLDPAVTPFVTFIDGDDMLHPQFVECLFAVALTPQASRAQASTLTRSNLKAPIAVARWKKFTGTPPSAQASSLKPQASSIKAQALNPHALDAQSALLSIFYQEKITNSACARLFDTRLFDGLRFPVGRLYEDIAIVYDLVMRAGTVAYFDEPLYYYRQRREGSITQRYTPARYDIVEILDDLEPRISAENPTILPALRSRQVSAAFNLLQLMPATEKDRIDHCWHLITERRAACLRDRRVRLKNKAALLLSFLGKRLTTALLRKLH